MTAKHENEPTQRGDDAAAGKKRPETLAGFLKLDTFIGAANGKGDPDYGKYRVSASKHGEEYADLLMEQYRRQQAEFAKYLREKEQQAE